MMRCEKCGSEFVRNSAGVVVDRHDCRYVRKVNALIPKAEAAADALLSEFVAPNGDAIEREAVRGRLFRDAMSEMLRAAGLRR